MLWLFDCIKFEVSQRSLLTTYIYCFSLENDADLLDTHSIGTSPIMHVGNASTLLELSNYKGLLFKASVGKLFLR